MRNYDRGLITILCVVAAGCWKRDENEPALPEGNQALGIASFVEEEVGDETIVRGLDDRGNEVARLELVHGQFTVTPPFTDELRHAGSRWSQAHRQCARSADALGDRRF